MRSLGQAIRSGQDDADDAAEDDTSSLQALIQRNAAKRSDSFLSSMEAKYGPGGSASTAKKAKGGKKGKKASEEEEHAAPDVSPFVPLSSRPRSVLPRSNRLPKRPHSRCECVFIL